MKKIDITNTAIAFGLSLLIAYGFYSIESSSHRLLISAGEFVFSACALVLLLAVDFDLPRTKVNVKILSLIFFILSFLISVLFSIMNFSTTVYVVLNGIVCLLFVLITKSIIEQRL